MMCDAVEAASRSLKEITEESISALVDKIVDGQLAEGHFKQAPITFLDIENAKDVMKKKLQTIFIVLLLRRTRRIRRNYSPAHMEYEKIVKMAASRCLSCLSMPIMF